MANKFISFIKKKSNDFHEMLIILTRKYNDECHDQKILYYEIKNIIKNEEFNENKSQSHIIDNKDNQEIKKIYVKNSKTEIIFSKIPNSQFFKTKKTKSGLDEMFFWPS